MERARIFKVLVLLLYYFNIKKLIICMKNIFDCIQESLLDDIDSLETSTDKIISKGWFDEYATGKYKIMITKAGTTKVWGDMIIKGYDGDSFPGLNITEFNGSLVIEKCPNITSLSGIWKTDTLMASYGPTTIKGDLTINNCPNLVELGCPYKVEGDFILVGNKNLKSLKGCPEMVFGNAHVMKNGKKFNEETIRASIYIGDNVLCSEETELANITEGEEIDEAMNNSYLLILAQQLKEMGTTFKQKFSHIHWAWDEIDSSNIKNFNWRFKGPDSKALTAARNVISDRTSGIILTYRYENGQSGKMKFIVAIDSNKNYINLNKTFGWRQATATELLDKVAGNYHAKNDGMVIIYYDQEITTYNKRSDRFESKKGIVLNTPEYYAKIARENIARYKKIIQTNKANRNTGEVEKVQKMVDAFLKDIMQASQNVMKNPMKYKDELLWLEKLNEYAYDRKRYDRGSSWGQDGVLVLFNTYMEIWTKTATGKETYIHGDANNRLTLLQEQIQKIIGDAQHYLNKFDV